MGEEPMSDELRTQKNRALRLELGIPVQIIRPRLMQIIRRKPALMLAQFDHRKTRSRHIRH